MNLDRPLIRTWLSAALTGRPLPVLATYVDASALIDAAEAEGVLCLLYRQLALHPQAKALPPDWLPTIASAARTETLDTLAVLAEQRKVFEALQAAGIRFLVMKGGALAHWLYAHATLRLVTDLDILLPEPAAVAALQPVLAALGYVPVVANPVANERSFRKPGGPFGHFIVDAHWRLFNRNLLRDDFSFVELQAQARVLPDCAGACGLSPLHALFNAIGHRALSLPHRHLQGIQHADSLRWLWDIHALMTGFDANDWQQAQDLAKDKGWSALLLEAIRRVQAEFDTSVPALLLEALRAQARSEPMQMHWFASLPRYQWREFLASDARWQGRGRWLWRRLWPDPAWVRTYYGGGVAQAFAWPRRALTAIRRLLW